MTHTIRVQLGRCGYPVVVGRGLLSRCAPLLRGATGAKRMMVLSTGRIDRFYGAALRRQVSAAGAKVSTLLVPDGETAKNPRTLLSILRGMARAGFHRDSALVVLGGGVLGDLGGMAASLYMRGIDVIQCPTTLLAQVDAAIGGKTAVDFEGIKNLVGTFHQPRLVLADPLVLRTLSERHFRTGLAEVVKHGVIRDAALFRRLERRLDLVLKREPGELEWLVFRSARIKARVVSLDEREAGLRAILNYGHTFGHAFESLTGYRLLTHGEAVAHGMVAAAHLSLRLGLCDRETVARQEDLLRRMGLLRPFPHFAPDRVLRRMNLDKKARGGRIQFVLTRKIGVVTIVKSAPKSLIFGILGQRAAANHGE